jgi:hypothetical protein
MVSELAEKYGGLDLPADIGRVAVADVRVVRMIAQVYGWNLSGLGGISDERFYGDRAELLFAPDAGGHTAAPGTAEQPLKLGYAEGWRNINAGMRSCVLLTLLLVFLILIPVFNEDRVLGTEDLLRSTKLGRKKLDDTRIVGAFRISALIYASAVAGITALALLVSFVIADAFTGYAALLFIAALSYAADTFDLTGFKHFVWNFSPAGAANFGAYCAGHETYLGIPSILFVPLASAVIAGAELLILRILLRKKSQM